MKLARLAAVVAVAVMMLGGTVGRGFAAPMGGARRESVTPSSPSSAGELVGSVVYASIPAPTGLGFVNGSTIFAVDASNGTKLWSRFIPGVQPGLTVSDGVIYVAWALHGSAGLYALRTADGSTIWRSSHSETVFVGSPEVSGNHIFMSFNRPPTHSSLPAVCAFQSSDGSLAWCRRLPISPTSSPVVDGTNLYVSEIDRLQAVNADSGAVLWTSFVQPSSQPVADPGKSVIVAGIYEHARQVLALSPSTGSVIWNVPAGQVSSAPVVSSGTAYFSDSASVVHALNASTGAQVWSVDTHDGAAPALLASGGILYAGARTTDGKTDQSTLRAFGSDSGNQLWQYSAPGAGSDGAIGVVAGTVVELESQPNALVGLDLADGSRRWGYPTDRNVNGAPVVAGSTVFAGSDDTRVYALNTATGARAWSATLAGPVIFSPEVLNGSVFAVTGYPDDSVHALNASTGQPLWSRAYTGNTVDAPPVVTSSAVVVATNGGEVDALDPATGKVLWTRAVSTSPGVSGGLAVSGSTIYVAWQRIACGCAKGSVTALGAADGRKIWSASVGGGGDPLAVSNGVLYVAAGGDIWARNAMTGKPIWKHPVKDHQFSSLTVGNGSVYAGATSTGAVYALTAAKGRGRWVAKLGSSVRALSLDGATIFAGANHATALASANGKILWKSALSDGSALSSSGGNLYVGALGPRYGGIYQLSEATGHVIWSVLTAQSPD